MEQIPPVFVRPGRARAIPIIDPRSGQPLPSTASSSRYSSVSSRDAPSNFDASSGGHQPDKVGVTRKKGKRTREGPAAGTGVDVQGPLQPKRMDDELDRGFDVYATPFVPEKLKKINWSDGTIFDTEPVKKIDFGAYVIQSLVPNLLPPVLEPLDANKLVADDQGPRLTPKEYEQFFRLHLEEEIRFQQDENASCSLYGHHGMVDFLPDGVARCTITVPGLRENSPYVEDDDIIQLRQLRSHNAMRLAEKAGMNPWSEGSHLRHAAAAHHSEPWTGLVFLARVSAVLRAKETLVLRVFGLTTQSSEILLGHPYHMSIPTQKHLKFNVQFPVPRERYFPMEHVLPQIQGALTAASNITYQDQGLGEEGNIVGAQRNQFWIQSMLFPTEADCDVQANLHSGNFGQQLFDTAINWEQRKAVENICSQNYGVLPYLISGPPGTGKTKTLIETALQLIRNVNKVWHILICAPSDPASDTLAARLKEHMDPNELLRLNRPSRAFTEVPDGLLPYCHIAQDTFALPPFAQLMSYKIVVTSCRDASMLMYARMTNSDLYATEYGLRDRIHPLDPSPPEVRLHWDALLIDEAAQATEPEALVPLYVVSPPPESPPLSFTPLFVMAGDEYQLGPRTAAPATSLKRSLLARLFARPVYADHPLARGRTGGRRRRDAPPPPLTRDMLPMLRPAFTNLIRNYRSHPAILAAPSSLFYADTLEPEAGGTDRLAGWEGWRGRGWPVLFCDNASPDDLEADAGGWYNAGEAAVACGYAARLVASGLVAQEEICIMSPFKAQVARLRKAIRAEPFGLWGVNVGPTEAFQGLEHGVVILCATRSRRRFVERDRALGWGIVGMPNKMNVALTRAKFGLIVIGKRDLLAEDPNWKAVLDFCDRNGLVEEGGADGARLDEGASTESAKLTRIEKTLLAQESGSDRSRVLGGRSGERDAW
ncbi:P-loop containing nucleoside triphosphate hydrolase protein [Phialemonium atrogriseum]|uniref:P-loop containing nucleoside triphosphate hydrolase protein n=1 Tax=Phialemonium atrogriseum TaxID=1093897 RepID=A0AAJ0FKC8_9PEZI|nr:P-loop containing nucleoside triphosphate hydrolase protein [Phialemonium atrogriseum]KAK1765404.1 P-loop containing nucleoside triphosphate hydrolase protein [Phialemonium atrogriseum]